MRPASSKERSTHRRTYGEWGGAWTRFERKVLALGTRVSEDVRRGEARGEEPKDMRKRSRPVEPLASFSEEGELVWNEELVSKIRALIKKKSAGGSAGSRGLARKGPR